MNGRARLPRTTRGLHLLIAVAFGALGISLSPVREAVVGAAPPPRGAWIEGSSAAGGAVVSDGTDGTPQYSYNLNLGGGGVPQRTFTFQSTSTSSGTISVPWAYTGFHAYFAVTVQLTPFVTHNGTTTVAPRLVDDGPVNCCTAPSAGFTYTGTHDFVVANGDSYGFTFGGSNFDSNSTLRGTLTLWPQTYTAAAAATIAQNTSWPNAAMLNGSTTGALLAPGEARWYKFPVTPSSQVQVDLSGLAQNYDLTMYTDIAQAFTTLTSTTDLTKVTAQATGNTYSPSIYSPSIYSPSIYSPSIYSPSIYSPSIYSPSIYSPSIYSPSIYSPSIYSPSIYSPSIYSASGTFTQAFSSAQSQSLIAISANEGTSPESIKAATWNSTGNFYVRVLGRNGASSPTPFTIGLTRSGGPCDGVTLDPHSTDATLAGTPGSFKTVIVTDTSRFALSQQLTDMKARLTTLANATTGVVVDVKDSPKVQALQLQADTGAACPYAKNLVAQAIRDIVNSYRDARGTLQYVVLAGSDNVIPFFRYADGAGIGEEKGFIAPVDPLTVANASLQNNLVFGQDAYGSLTDLTMKGGVLPVPDLAVGRLVETPAEISALIDNYISTPVLLSASSLSTGYSFLTSAADAINASFTAGGAAGDTLITDQGVKTTDTTQSGTPARDRSWTATDLKNALFNSRHDLVFLGGHFNAQGALAADNSTSVYTTDLESHPSQLQNSLVISVGCHSGFNLQDSDSTAAGTQLDWPEEMARQRATFIGGTGYQYEDTDFLAYSAKLYAGVAHQLLAGTTGTPVAVGQALVKAKLDYLSGLGTVTGIDQKALIESTIYGLPMVGIDMPHGRLGTPATYHAPITPTPVAAGTPGAQLGLKSSSFEQTPVLDPSTPGQASTKPVLDFYGNPTTLHAQWHTGPDGVQTGPALPALPQQFTDVTSSTGEVLRGVGFRSGTYSDQPGVLPLTGAPTMEQNNLHTTFGSPAFFPQRLATVNYFDDLATTGSGGTTRLITTAAQYRSDGPTTDTERTYSHLGLSLFYSSNTHTYGQNTPALSAPPSISAVAGQPSPNPPPGIAVAAHVTGDPSAGIQQVWVTYTGEAGPLHSTWNSVDLHQDPTDSTLWTGTFGLPDGQSARDVRFIIQAVNGVGLVGADNNIGDGYTPTLSNIATTLSLTAPQAAQNTSSVSATLTRNDTHAAVAGRVVTFSFNLPGGGVTSASGVTGLDGVAHVVGVTVPDGTYTVTAAFAGTSDFASASATARPTVIDTTPPTIVAVAVPSPATGLNGWYKTSPVTVRFTCSDPGGSGIDPVACPADQALGGQGSASSTSQTVTDIAGNVSAASNVVTVKVDSVPPTINSITPNTFILHGPTTVVANATDGGSGLASARCDALSTATVGPHTVTCTAIDNAGNATTQEMPYRVIYRVDGFLQPINDPNICGATCAMSVFKGGSTVPVKFQLKDANGVIVQSTLTPAWYTPTRGVSSTLPISESTYSDTPTTGITYRWDGSSQYMYNWGTKGLATNAYWTIGVTLDDGTSHLVVVSLS